MLSKLVVSGVRVFEGLAQWDRLGEPWGMAGTAVPAAVLADRRSALVWGPSQGSLVVVLGLVTLCTPGPAFANALTAHTSFKCTIRSLAANRYVTLATAPTGTLHDVLVATLTTPRAPARHFSAERWPETSGRCGRR